MLLILVIFRVGW